ncbi:MAG: cadherin-like domain-containing protein [Elainellaceae cyanobacterium]
MANKLFSLADINGLNGFLIEGTLSGLGYAGYSVSGAGDINGDGIDDVIVGTAFTDTSYVVFGQAGGPPAKVELANLDGTNGFIIQGPSGSYAGTSVSSAGDINGDGIDDLIIGARGLENNDGTDAGGSYVILGRRNSFGASLDLTTLDGTNGFVFRGTDRWDWTGFSVSGAGDINGDGFDDVIFSAPGIDVSTTLGKTYVLFGKAGGFDATLSPSDLNGVNGFVLNGIGLRDYTGWSVSSAGDVNGDGFDDLLIGARWADPASAPSSGSAGGNGQVYVVFGKSDNFASNFDLATLDGTNGFAIDGFFDISANAYGSLGRAVSNAGDMNGDGFDDIIVTANGGVSYVIFGRGGGFSPNLLLSSLDGTNGFKVFASESVNSVSFASVSSAGDLNADGFDDLIFGLPEEQLSDREAGAAYILFGKATGFGAVVNLSEIDGTGVFAITGIGEYQFAGFSVSDAGDVNADGIDDVIIGAPNSIFGGSPNFQEESYVVYGNAAPELDLNGSEAGIDFVTSIDFTATSNGLTPIISSPIVAGDFTISDRNSSTLAGAIITLTNPLDSFEEGFTVNTSGTNITATQSAGILTLSGIDTLANYEKVLKGITYLNTALTITPGDRLVEVTVDDGGAHSNTSALATTTIRYNTNPGNVYTVDTLVDENDGDYSAGDLSLREAIQLVNAGGTIFFDSSLATADVGFGQGTIGLTSDLTIAKSVNIKGLGADRLKVAEGTASFLQINDGVATNSDVLIDGLTLLGVGVLNQETFTLTNSAIVGEGLENYGNATVENTTITLSSNGGIRNYSYTFGRGIVTVANSFITDNRSDGNGGGISNLNGSVTVIDSVIANNISTNTSSLISGSAGGGGIANLEGFVSVSGSTISGNSSAADGGGLLNFAGTISIGDSIFEGNSTSSDGGGIFSRGVGATVTNTQLIGNSASTGGGLYVRGGLTLTDSTIANNTAQFEGGGVYVEFNGDFTAINSAIANNTPDDIFQFNSPPTALDDVYTLDDHTTLTVDAPNGVLANDFDQDGDRLSVILLEPVNKGSLTLNPDGSFTYIPDPNANGFDLFTYEVNDGNGGTNIGFVDLFINPVNDAPVAQDDTAATDANTPITLLASALLSNDSDVDSAIDGDILSIIGVSNAINGSVALDADGNVLFTPAAGFSGTASFNYTVSDGNSGSDTATVAITVEPVVVNDKLAVIAQGATELYDVASYGGSQDVTSQLIFTPDGSSLDITGNSWKKLALDYTVTSNTTLKFDFRSTARGEIHGIGFDADNNISSNRTFKLYGQQNWGIQDFNNYAADGTWQSYEIPVGDFFTGQMKYLTFANDHDVANPTANSQFRNIELVEVTPPDAPVVTVTVNDSPKTYTLDSAYSNQDLVPQVTSTPDGSELQLGGNSWKRIDLDYTITADTILELEFRSTAQGEIHGIGFDDDNRLSRDRLFQFYGTQNWGINTYQNYSSQAGEWKFYQIRVGDFFTGDMSHLILTNDHDTANPNAISQFRNLKVYEGTNTQLGTEGNSTLIGGSGDDTLIGVNPNGLAPGSSEVDVLTGQGGADTFVLGDVTRAYYNDGTSTTPGLEDYALVRDFNGSEGDRIQLSGTAANYELQESPLGNGTAVYQTLDAEPELIGIIEGVSNLSFNSSAFHFV